MCRKVIVVMNDVVFLNFYEKCYCGLLCYCGVMYDFFWSVVFCGSFICVCVMYYSVRDD